MGNMKSTVFTWATFFFLAVSVSILGFYRYAHQQNEGDDLSVGKTRPNFVIFLADDIGWGDLGANWKPSLEITPNLNQLAKEGLRFTDFHSASSICAPSRASLLTGRLGLRNGMVGNVGPGSLRGLSTEETTLPEVLLASGYRTGMVGKWHLGTTSLYAPNSRGFEYYYGIPYSNDMGCLDVPTFNRPTCRLCLQNITDPGGPEKVCRNSNVALPLFENREIVEQPVDHIQLGDNYARKATDFVKAASKSDKPFFLYVAFAHMHLPLAHAPRFTNSTNVRTVYADTLYEMDDIIGRVVTSLKVNGVYDNTMVWFTGDNGPWQGKCPYSGDSGPFLGTWLLETFWGGSTAKGTNWEAGHRQPAVVVWPDRIPPNRTSKALTSAMDLFPTVVHYAGAEMPKWRRFDGMNLASIIEGKTDKAHEVLFHPNSGVTGKLGHIDTIRMGPYKVFWKTGGKQATSRMCSGPTAPEMIHDPPMVFNIETDPAESQPLTAKLDPNFEKILGIAERLRSDFLEDVRTDNTSRRLHGNSKAVQPCCDSSQYLCRCNKQATSLTKLPAFLSGKFDITKSGLS